MTSKVGQCQESEHAPLSLTLSPADGGEGN